jgi:DNA-binding ferritin-like protein
MLERQRRQYEEILQTMKNDATTKQQALRQDLEFASKMQQREFATNQNQLIRDYEKRIGEQKTEYDQIISDLKNQTEQLTRENDKKNRQLLEEQARGYEQRLSQLEFQHKERERYVSQGFEDQMDKLKATNALLQKRIRV